MINVSVDIKDAFSKLTGIQQTMREFRKTGLAKYYGRRIVKRVRDQINILPYHGYTANGHNTPQSLNKTIFVDYKDAYLKVEMKRKGRGIKPEWVEYGTRRSDKSSRGPNDRGSVAKHPFEKAILKFISYDVEQINNQVASLLVNDKSGGVPQAGDSISGWKVQ